MAGTSIMPDYNPNYERPRRIYSVLKALLVIGFTYWLIVASILVYLLVLAQSLESEHLCVWVGCTFVLLVVFGAVLFLGLMVVHYLHDDAINHKQYNSTSLAFFHMDFLKLVNMNTLIPLLCQRRVLYGCDLQTLHQLWREPRAVQVGKLIAILDTKGKEGIITLIECLMEDMEHIGHWELAKILEDSYSVELMEFQRSATTRRTDPDAQWA